MPAARSLQANVHISNLNPPPQRSESACTLQAVGCFQEPAVGSLRHGRSEASDRPLLLQRIGQLPFQITDPAALATKALTLLEASGEPAIVVCMEVAQEPVLAGHVGCSLAKFVHDKQSARHSLPWR